MAARRSRRRSAPRRSTYRSRSGYSRGRSAARGGAVSRRRPANKRRSGGGPRTQRIVVEFAGAAPVREGDVVGLTKKVTAAPRLKPKL